MKKIMGGGRERKVKEKDTEQEDSSSILQVNIQGTLY